MGDERTLRYELLDAARGATPRSHEWKKSQGDDSYFSGRGSQNIWLLRFATQALLEHDIPWREVYYYQLGTHPPDWSPPENIQPAYGGSEFLSTIYWGWHLAAHLALTRHSDPYIAALARRWCVLNWVLFRAITAPDGSLLLFGQRSAGHNPIPRETDWWYALAQDDPSIIRRAEKWCKIAGCGLKRSWEYEFGSEFLPEMRATYQESLSISPDTLRSVLPLRVPSEVIRTTDGIALVHHANCNPNTPPILAGVKTSSRADFLPPQGGRRIRQKFDHAVARIEGDQIIYSSSLYTDGAEIRMALPSGETISHLRFGIRDSVTEPTPISAPISTPTPEPPPADAPSPVSSDMLHRAANLIASLQLSRRHKSSQHAIIEALRRGEDPEPFLPIIRSWFRTDSPQPQSAQWREALAILEIVIKK